MAGPLVITPLDQVVTAAPGAMPTVQYAATVNGMSVAPQWTIDRGEIGSIDVATVCSRRAGTIGGKATITAKYSVARPRRRQSRSSCSRRRTAIPAIPAPAPGPGGYGGVGGAGRAGRDGRTDRRARRHPDRSTPT